MRGVEYSLGVREAWDDLRWLKHMHQLPVRLRRERGVNPAAEAARAELLGSDCGPSACFNASCFSFSDPGDWMHVPFVFPFHLLVSP